ncbi:MAG: hypothetical protein ACTHJ2_09320 [Candidatus Nitrosocosmicus sp.]
MIEQTSTDINNGLTTSHELANDLRELYDLPQLPPIGKDVVVKSADIITNLNGILKDYADSEENPIDAITFIREHIS